MCVSSPWRKTMYGDDTSAAEQAWNDALAYEGSIVEKGDDGKLRIAVRVREVVTVSESQ